LRRSYTILTPQINIEKGKVRYSKESHG